MSIYILVFFLLGISACASLSLSSRFRILQRALALISGLFLILFMGTRLQVGEDWFNYEAMYHVIVQSPFWIGEMLTEPAYAACNYIGAFLGGGLYTVNVICAFIVVLSILKCSRLIKVDTCFTLFLLAPYFLFVVCMGYTRQGVAIALMMLALSYLATGRKRKFYLVAFSAAMFHFSAIILIIFVWINSLKRLLIVAIPILISLPIAFHLLAETRYTEYEDMQSHGVWFRFFIFAIGFAILFCFRRSWKKDYSFYLLAKKFGFLFLLLIPIATFASTLADRTGLYLFFFYLLGFGRSLRYAGKGSKNIMLIGSYGFSLGIMVLWFTVSVYAAKAWVPYRSFLLP